MYKTILNDPRTGQIYNSNGTLFRRGIDERYLDRQFLTLERAQKFGRGIVRRYPYLECIVLDENDVEMWRYRNDDWLQKESVLWQATQTNHQQQERREKYILLGAMILFALLNTVINVFLLTKEVRLETVVFVAVGFSILAWLAITLRR